MLTRTKICGIRSEHDLRVAVEAGADAVGFICGVTHVSEDALDPLVARRFVSLTPPFVSTVLVTHRTQAEDILDLADTVRAGTIQVHGLVSLATLEDVVAGARGRRVIRAVHVSGTAAVEAARDAAERCDAVLLDSRTVHRLGGTGRTHDWEISRQIVRELTARRRTVILAGGLCPENIVAAIDAVGPYAVDVNTGVEDEHGDKHSDRCAAFVSGARSSRRREAQL